MRRARNAAKTAAAVLMIVGASVLAAAPGAWALTKPTVATGGTHSVSYASAVVSGSVNPNGRETYYYVQYGQTAAYGAQTGIVQAGAGTPTPNVSVALGGLQPLTVYHYRFVAVNAAGASAGSDRKILTNKGPVSA